MRVLTRHLSFIDRIVVFAFVFVAALALVGTALAALPGDEPPITDPLGSWAALVGIGLPPIVALIQRSGWSGTINAALFAAACVLASIVYGFIRFKGNFTWTDWEATLLAIVTWGIGTYHAFWKQGGEKSVVAKLRAVPVGVLPAKTGK